MSEIVRLQVAQGITRFKCSTLAEADITASAGGTDVLLAMQPVGQHIEGFFRLMAKYRNTRFSVIVDDFSVVNRVSQIAEERKTTADLWVDINNGMNRTGISPGKQAFELYAAIAGNPHLKIRGLHVYDGHIRDRELIDRHVHCENDFKPVRQLISDIVQSGLEKPVVVAGGTPTFPIHARREDTETSPGTCLLWDSGYDEKFPDLNFLQAAVLLMRVVSKPAENLICLDLGHKAVAAEMPHPRIKFFELKPVNFINHSEEHLVVEPSDASNYSCGDLIYGVPWHICPTVPRYPFAYTVQENRIVGRWVVDARDR